MDEITPTSRAGWLGLLARAPQGRLAELCAATAVDAPFNWLRRPETGTVMVRGRVGGTGQPFNLGEITVTRAALQLATGETGHGHVQGRDKEAARLTALLDALMQTSRAEAIRSAILAPLAAELQARTTDRAEKAAATRVEFFTLVRGEDQ